MFGYDTKWTV